MPHHPDRAWRLQGASNFRDLGGYPGRGGRTLRWRRLFRSDHLGALTAADRARLVPLGLAQAFDFRGVAERAAAPYELPGLAQHSLAIEPTVVQRMQDLAAAGRTLTAPLVVGLMKDLYRAVVNDQAHQFAVLFEHLLQADAPVVFHCTAGKDRTGIAAALILLALGVPRELVLQDFLLTNQLYRHPPLPDSETPPEALAVLWQVQAGFLHAAFEAIDGEHGGVERYLGRRVGLSRGALDALEKRYLSED
ncbi:MAG: tyrosine-protein phosphatase [Ideonella sp.]|nr:tyrosine-protein phosphatase [Ideonella sp.]